MTVNKIIAVVISKKDLRNIFYPSFLKNICLALYQKNNAFTVNKFFYVFNHLNPLNIIIVIFDKMITFPDIFVDFFYPIIGKY